MFIYINQFCLIWKSQGVSFNEATEELKPNFQVVDNVTSDKHVESFIKYEQKPKKFQSPISNVVIYDIETFITIECVPCANCIYKVSKTFGGYNRDVTEKEYQKCK